MMYNLGLTIRNYRCFSQEDPLKISIRDGFTAFIGPNNAGKSTILKFFYELRELFKSFNLTFNNIDDLIVGKSVYFDSESVKDFNEICCSSNNGDISIEYILQDYQDDPLAEGTLIISRGRNEYRWKSRLNDIGVNINAYAFDRSSLEINNPEDQLKRRYSIKILNKIIYALRNSLYVGPCRNALNGGGADYFDLQIGDKFVSMWQSWKTGLNKSDKKTIDKVTEDIRKIFGFSRLEINASQSAKTLSLVVDGEPHNLSELGSGMAQMIISLGVAAVKKPNFILIDEPEISLHPQLQIDFLTCLASYAKIGVIFATHSIGLARSVSDRIYTVQKKGNISTCRPYESTTNLSEFVGSMSFSSFQDLGFDKLLLVEGPTELRTIQQFLRFYDKEHKVVLVPLGGTSLIKPDVEHELHELTRLCKDVSYLIDSERTTASEPLHNNRTSFARICKSLKISGLILERRATENYLTDAAIKQIKGDSFRALGHYEKLEAAPLGWRKGDNWRIANSMRKEDLDGTDLGEFLSRL